MLIAPTGTRPRAPFVFNRASRQARDLDLWVPGGYLDYARGVSVTRQTSVSSQGATPEGLGLRSIANNEYFPLSPLTVSVPFTLAWWGFRTSAAGGNPVFITSGVTTSLFYGAWLSLGEGAAWYAQFGDGTGSASSDYRRATGTTTPEAGRLIHLVAVCRGDTDWSLYYNGTSETVTTSGTGGAIATHAGNACIGRAGTITNAANAVTLDVRVYNRALLDHEVWQLYQPRTRWELYGVPAFPIYAEAFVAAGGRTTKNTRSHRLGVSAGVGWRVAS